VEAGKHTLPGAIALQSWAFAEYVDMACDEDLLVDANFERCLVEVGLADVFEPAQAVRGDFLRWHLRHFPLHWAGWNCC
jgi:hypothetical protein